MRPVPHHLAMQPAPSHMAMEPDPGHLVVQPVPSHMAMELDPGRPAMAPREPMMLPDALSEPGPMLIAPRSDPIEPQPQPIEPQPQPIELQPEPAAIEPVESAPEAMIPEQPRPLSTGNEQPSGYTTVRVFYGTDRAAETGSTTARPVFLSWLVITMLLAVATVILMLIAYRLYRTAAARLLAVASLVATAGLGIMTVYAGLQNGFAIKHAKPTSVAYGGQRGQLELGTCEVSIPPDHQVGELEAPRITRFEFREDPQQHVTLLDTRPIPAEEFFRQCRLRVEQSTAKGAFVFIHGYNVSFEDAARRTAQIAHDLRFDGAPIFYSWPSQGKTSQYTVDETNVVWTVPHLRQFLTDVAGRSGARQIHLIAHSMGNRAMTSALRDLSFLPDESRPKFHEVVLTAPDIDAEVFKNDIAPAIVKTAQRVTLYASSNDHVLTLSKQVHGYARAGDTGRHLLVLPGIDTIDVSAVDTSLLGHNYYGDNETVLTDIFSLLHEAKPPEQREWLRTAELGAMKYWVFQR